MSADKNIHLVVALVQGEKEQAQALVQASIEAFKAMPENEKRHMIASLAEMLGVDFVPLKKGLGL